MRRFLTRRAGAAQGRGADRGVAQLLPLRLPRAAREQPFSVTTEVGAAPWNPAHRLLRIGIKGRSLETRAVPAEQPGLPARRVRLDEPPEQAAAGEAGVPDAGAAAAPAGPRGHRGLRRARGPGAAVHPRRPTRRDPGGPRQARGGRQHRGRRGHPAGLRGGAALFARERQQPRHPGDRWRLQRGRELATPRCSS